MLQISCYEGSDHTLCDRAEAMRTINYRKIAARAIFSHGLLQFISSTCSSPILADFRIWNRILFPLKVRARSQED